MSTPIVRDDAVIDGAVQRQAVALNRQRRGRHIAFFSVQFGPFEDDRAVVARRQMRVGVKIDGRVQDRAAEPVAIRRKIGSTACQAQP